jgi:hypothetical protein
MVKALRALALMAVAILAAQDQAVAAPPAVACSPEKPTAWPREVIWLKAWAAAETGPPLTYAWMATAGTVEGGAEARWDFTEARPGVHTARVRVRGGAGEIAECSVQVVVVRGAGGGRGPVPPPPGQPRRETGWAFLVRDQVEAPDYGLYSYLLLGAPPTEAARERYLKTIEAYLRLVPEIAQLEKVNIPRRELNVTYLLTEIAPGDAVSAEWVLLHYDYARARAILRTIPGSRRDGPYLLSVLQPLTVADGPTSAAGPYLFQDLSAVPPHLASTWVTEFLNQAAQERFWEAKTGQRLVLKLRVTIGILGAGLPEVKKALDTWIAWVR